MLDERRLTLDHFRAFVTVVDTGSFAGAAQALSRTQSALTHQIKAAEDILGTRLLVRTRGHFSGLTEEGMRLLPHAHRVLGSVQIAVRSVAQHSLSGSIRIGVMDDFDIEWLLQLIARFEAKHPLCQLTAVSDLSTRLEARLQAGEIDIAVIKRLHRESSEPHPQLLRMEQLQWVAAPQLDWAKSDPLPLVMFHEGCAYRRRMLEVLQGLGIPSRIAYQGHSYANIRAAVSAGLGFSLLPETQIPSRDCVAMQPRIGGHVLPEPGYAELVALAAAEKPTLAIEEFRSEIKRQIQIR